MSEDEPPLESGAFDFEAAVRRLVEHHFKVAPRDVRQLTGGLNNRVFAVEHDTRRLVVRLSDQAQCLNTFLKEQWAIDAARQAGVPAPDVLEVGNDVIGVPYMVMDHVEGTIGTEAEDLRGRDH